MEHEQYTEDITNDEWMRYAHEAGALKEQCIADWVREAERDVLRNRTDGGWGHKVVVRGLGW